LNADVGKIGIARGQKGDNQDWAEKIGVIRGIRHLTTFGGTQICWVPPVSQEQVSL